MNACWCRTWASEPREWPQPALSGKRMAKDQSYCSPTGRITIINPTFILSTWPREERLDPLSRLSATLGHSPEQDNKTTWWSHTWPTRGLCFNQQHNWMTPSQKPDCRKQNLLRVGVTRRVHLLSADLLQDRALGNPSHWVSKAKSSKKVNPLGDNKLSVPTWSG